MSMIQFVAGRQWTIKMPALVRYMESKFVEQFFATGELMLSTYKRCANHNDSNRKDANEGSSTFTLLDGESIISGFQKVGQASYMLCASMADNQTLMDKFNADAFISINDVTAFADAVSRHIPGFTHGHMGACVYRPERTVARNLSGQLDLMKKDITEILQRSNETDIEIAIQQARQRHSAELEKQLELDHFFIKDNSFGNEAEFRIVWNVPYEVSGPLYIKCPEAIQFCNPDKPRAPDAPSPPAPISSAQGAMALGLSARGVQQNVDMADREQDSTDV